MTRGIRMKIFLPVLLLLIAFPIASWMIFKTTARNYMDSSARKELYALVEEMRPLITSAASGMNTSEDTWPDQVQELLKDTKARLKVRDSQADMMIFSSKPKLSYPKPVNLPPEAVGFYQYCQDILEKGKSTEALLTGRTITLEQTRYLAELLELPGDEAIRAKYFIAYIAVPDYTPLLAVAGRLVFLITAALAVLSGIIVWIMARNMEKPLKLLCRHTEQLGRKEFSSLEDRFSVRELEELKCAVNDMAEQLACADMTQTTFFQNVSHELRTPLMSICGYAQGIEQGIFPDTKKAAHVIAGESQRLKELVDSILTLSKLDSKKLTLSPCLICLNELAEELTDRLEGMASARHIKLHCLLPGQELMIHADAGLLLQALSNVVSNAIVYASHEVTLSLFLKDSSPVITVEDDGPGIPSEDLPHIFERFYKGKNGSFGLGLSLVKSSIEYMNGSAAVSSTQSGTTFTLSLPVLYET